MTKSVEFIIKT